MIVQQVTPAPRFTRGSEGEIALSTRLAIAIYAENATEEEWLRDLINEIMRKTR